MFAVSNTYETSECSDGSLHSRIGMRVIFLPVAVSVDNRFTVSVYPRVERQCAHSILRIVLDNGTGIDTFLLIHVSLCPMNLQTSRPPLSSATVRRPVAATWPPLRLINSLLITFPRTIRVPELSQRPLPMPMMGKALGHSQEGNRLLPPSEPTVPCQYMCCATIPTPGSPSEASGCTASASASCPLPGATACSIPAPSTSTGSSTPWAHRPSTGFTTRPWPSAAATCSPSIGISRASVSAVRQGTVSDIPMPACPSGSPLQRTDCNTVFICIIYLVSWRTVTPVAASDRPCRLYHAAGGGACFPDHYQPGLIN